MNLYLYIYFLYKMIVELEVCLVGFILVFEFFICKFIIEEII